MEEQPRSKWKELLEICIIGVHENKKVTNLWLINLKRNISLLEQGLASLALQVGGLEFNMGVLATAIGSKNTPGTLPSLPEINPKGKCHVVQLCRGTTYQPPQAAYLGRGRKEREQESTDLTPAADQTQRAAAHFHSGPPEASQPAEPDSDTDAESSPAAAAPFRSSPPPECQSPYLHKKGGGDLTRAAAN
ncbi:hypothetical protein SASPL_101829 [Salvia splendens]|uniref:Uncharacterized protein n=1 Tax=Salvia splendens TaxID=180675 RepID=A0A8X8YWF2_SALSN|nr:hypothetical protein SASPL_101829 [Salvia splendens]